MRASDTEVGMSDIEHPIQHSHIPFADGPRPDRDVLDFSRFVCPQVTFESGFRIPSCETQSRTLHSDTHLGSISDSMTSVNI